MTQELKDEILNCLNVGHKAVSLLAQNYILHHAGQEWVDETMLNRTSIQKLISRIESINPESIIEQVNAK